MIVFKQHLLNVVNPDLLRRLWLRQGMPGVFEYHDECDITIYEVATPFGIYRELKQTKWKDLVGEQIAAEWQLREYNQEDLLEKIIKQQVSMFYQKRSDL